MPRFAALLTGVAAVSACGGPALPSDVSWESEHFVYKTRSTDAAVCADILQPLEEHFRVMQKTLGFVWPSGQKVTYYKYLDGEDLRQNSECGSAQACTNGTSVQTPFSLDGHELVHAYLHPAGFPPWLLVEGAAAALGCELSLFPRPATSWRVAYEGDRRGSELRGAGAWLSGFLLRFRGPSSFLELYRRAAQTASAAEFAALFEEIYGESLDAAWAEATTLGRPPVFCPWECSREPAPVNGATPVSTASVCGLSAQHTIQLAQDSELLVRLENASGFGLGGCGDGSSPPRSYWSVDEGQEGFGVYLLAAGRYFFDGPQAGATLTLTANLRNTWVTSACVDNQPEPPWRDLRGGLQMALSPGSWRVPLLWSTPRSVLAFPTWSDPSSSASVCAACGAVATACTPTTTERPFAATVQGQRFLDVAAAPADDRQGFFELTVIAR